MRAQNLTRGRVAIGLRRAEKAEEREMLGTRAVNVGNWTASQGEAHQPGHTAGAQRGRASSRSS